MQIYQFVKAPSQLATTNASFTYAVTEIDKVQGLNLEEGVVNFGLQKQRTFG